MSSESLFTKCSACGKDIQKSAKKCSSCGKTLKVLSPLQWAGIVLLALFVIGYINSPTAPVKTEKESLSSKKLRVISNIKLVYEWKREGFGTVMEVDFIIKNNSEYTIKDIEIECEHFSKSGTKIDSNNRTIYELFEAKSSKSYPNFNMGFIHEQANTSSCLIKDISLVNQ